MNPTPGPPEIPPGPPSGFLTAPTSPAPAPAPHPVGPPVPPVPPQGPGVVPPFAAPPTEGRTKRLWLGLGVAGVFALLCCGGGIASVAGLTVFGVRAIEEQARVVVTDYVEALQHAEYADAYALLCDSRQRAQSPTDFAATESLAPRIDRFQVGSISTGSTNGIIVPVDVTYATGSSSTLSFTMAQDRGTGGLEVCGVTD
ncbi:hypothetical protein Ais01nite_66710 [Asanoa ishikariensis]|uniref:DUF3887 domain-containing protein n=1 Tax=Asanoa ishikariensis TaxID=137265 RepID=A0A1H3NGA4_9ACTN|nr:hypothetical protein [Asanoa ishikariensis]GIF68636.1 hypothetical protein Ais01nite_66710 [Asanoa ishikariensis]SDY87908.1 hypothetical protein SAMN05421684_2055 [Asanoa ishikariensis]